MDITVRCMYDPCRFKGGKASEAMHKAGNLSELLKIGDGRLTVS